MAIAETVLIPTIIPPAKRIVKLDLGCGQSKRDGFLGVDNCAAMGVDFVHDLLTFPWPFEDESVEEVFSSHFLEHVPGKLRGQFMDELYRVMTIGGKALFVTPYWASSRAIQDYTHEWPPVCEQSYLYFNRQWREQNRIGHYLCSCDFDFTYGYVPDAETALKSQETQAFHFKHYLHAIVDLHTTLIKRAKI